MYLKSTFLLQLAKSMKKSMTRKIVLMSAVGLFVLIFVLFCMKTGLWSALMNETELQQSISKFGWKGPLVLMMLMAGAIVISPLPSAPIALASGALYGHTWGTVYVAVGAIAGALIAFSLAREIGREKTQKLLGKHLSMRLPSSQNGLMLAIFIFRLIPFISFDIVSYVAGLTDISWWRFSLATVAGVIPVSFLLAHFGKGMVGGGTRETVITVLVLGLLTAIPVIVVRRRKKRKLK